MKILLTGATGLIGKEVGKHLVDHGHEVISITRNKKNALEVLPFHSTVLEWSFEDKNFKSSDVEKLQGVDAVVNLMGENLSEHRWTDAFKNKLYTSRVNSTHELIRALSSIAVPKVWIQGSAIGFYGASTAEAPFDEFSKKGEGFLSDLCNEWEKTLELLDLKTRPVILRTGVVFSHRGGALSKMISPILNGLGGRLGSGNQMMSLIHVQDCARFIVHALEQPEVRGVYNLVSETPISQNDLNRDLCRELHVSEGPPVPTLALKALLGEMADIILLSQAVVSKRFQETGFKLQYPRVADILAEVLHWHRHPHQNEKSVFIQVAEQFVPKPLEEIFPFFSEAKNLEKLTPDFLEFKITDVSTQQIEQGTKIKYRLKLHGIPIFWKTDIAVWDPPHAFVDNQEKGPYSLWYHEHRFKSVPGGTLMEDWVRFELPGGKLGQWLGFAKVKSDVERIFKYRRKIVQELFGA